MLKALHFFEKCSEQWMNYCDSPKQPLWLLLLILLLLLFSSLLP